MWNNCKKYKPHLSKKVAEDLENILKRDFTNQNADKNKHIIFHTDLGYKYTSNDLKELCKEFNIIQSFSKKGCPYDNVCIESFHS